MDEDDDTDYHNRTIGATIEDNKKFMHDIDSNFMKKNTQKMKKLDLSQILKDDGKHDLPKMF